jgi:ribulose-bisphosphate carboxylase small chain
MRITQGTFSFLPDLSDEQIEKQVQYALDNNWPISIEYTDDPHPRNSYWDMYGLPLFDIKDAAAVMAEIKRAMSDHPGHYIKINAYDARLGRQTTAISFIVQRPEHEPGFRLDRLEAADRQIRYQIHAYAADEPHGERYRNSR